MPYNFIKRLLGNIHYAINLRDHALVNYLTPAEKRERLAVYCNQYTEFVETGTYLGETTAAMAGAYARVHTIEIDRELYSNAIHRFSGRPSIFCYQGDSAAVLPMVVNNLLGPAVFWLDGHYSGPRTGRASDYDTPIIAELETIFKSSKSEHLILIDDARLFVGRNSYPTIYALNAYVREHSRYILTIRDDIIRLCYDPEWS